MRLNGFISKIRIIVFALVFTAAALYITVAYGKLAFTPPGQIVLKPETPRRGSIFDKNGKPLAVQTDFYHIAVTPSAIGDIEYFAQSLAEATELSPQHITAAIKSAASDFLYLKKKITKSQKTAVEDVIKAKSLAGIRFDKIPGRVYPENALASQVIGFMGDSGNGLSGIEYSMQQILMPKQNEKNASGKNVFLTIDANLQYKLEQIAYASIKETQAESFMLIACEAHSGEILSYISLPAANLNFYPSSSIEEQIDRPAVLAYEPGSVFKIFTAASFLNSGAVGKNEVFVCNGRHEVRSANGEKAVITCLGTHGPVTVREALQYSCNDAMAQMSEKMDSERFLQSLRNFGFGSRTGIELPSETRGSLKSVNDRYWSVRSKPTMSIGQEISVSALQIVQAATALANGGVPVQLTLVSKITDSSGNEEYRHTPSEKKRAVSKATADYILSCMETTARYGTGTKAALKDISIGVKTGTAQMLDPDTGKYSKTDFVSNCAAVFPIDRPQIVLYIVITKAKGETLSGRIVAPVIADAANVIIDHLGLARGGASSLAHSGRITFQTDKLPEIGDTLPDFTGLPKRLLTPLLNRNDLNVIIKGDGWVKEQKPAAGTAVTKGMTVELILE
ncbi:penicillin-binding protein [Treponema lecithinolyticum]|uniref:penicillin-binding protein n=1 Tax=Treponema lecithinolyticum TaxID=53418 RepID=UPI0028E7B691|nr:penicillin-binding protein [Treponema lecithinolyticum]